MDAQKHPKDRAPSVIGLGFVVLDLVFSRSSEYAPTWAVGGSCGNVTSILSFLGWSTTVASLIGNDVAGDMLDTELTSLGVDTSFLIKGNPATTPIVVQHNSRTASGDREHIFSFQCPYSGTQLPRFRPYPTKHVISLVEHSTDWDVLYIDRATPAATLMAREMRAAGGLVVFEPTSEAELTREPSLLQHVQIVKFSGSQIPKTSPSLSNELAALQICTHGPQGLSYRLKGGQWRHLPPFAADHIEDSAGSGDWVTASFIDGFYNTCSNDPNCLSDESIVDILSTGQRRAAENCAYAGARGLMEAYASPCTPSLDVSSPMPHKLATRKYLPRNIAFTELTQKRPYFPRYRASSYRVTPILSHHHMGRPIPTSG